MNIFFTKILSLIKTLKIFGLLLTKLQCYVFLDNFLFTNSELNAAYRIMQLELVKILSVSNDLEQY